jgi:hypothetical protein
MSARVSWGNSERISSKSISSATPGDDRRDRDTGATHARHATHDPVVDGDPLEGHAVIVDATTRCRLGLRSKAVMSPRSPELGNSQRHRRARDATESRERRSCVRICVTAARRSGEMPPDLGIRASGRPVDEYLCQGEGRGFESRRPLKGMPGQGPPPRSLIRVRGRVRPTLTDALREAT